MTETLVARWESRGGRDWVELRKDAYGYVYSGNGCSGGLGTATLEQAMEFMEQRTAAGMRLFCSQKSAMKKVIDNT